MSAKGQTEKNSVRAHVFRFALELGHCSTQLACLKRARTGPHMPFYEESDATRAARLFRLAYGRRLRCLLKAHSGVGADAPEHDLVPGDGVARYRARSRIARCEVRYNREKILLVKIGYNLG